MVDSLSAVMLCFNILIGLIGVVALILTFFLLLVSTTQNVKDNVWEYGVLRSIGVTKKQGYRIYMYEAFMIIIAAGMLGLAIGLIVAATVTSQFFLFLELPF